MVETRTETIVARESGRKVDAWHPERDRVDVSARVQGEALVATVRRYSACTWALGERRRVATRVEKSANPTDLALEAAGGGLLMLGGAALSSRHTSKDESNSNFDDSGVGRAAGMVLFAMGAAVGAAFVIDVAAGGEETTERTDIVRTGAQESQECAVRPAEGALVAFAIDRGPLLSCRVAADGRCAVAIDAATWEAFGGVLSVDVSIDGRVVRHERLQKGAP